MIQSGKYFTPKLRKLLRKRKRVRWFHRRRTQGIARRLQNFVCMTNFPLFVMYLKAFNAEELSEQKVAGVRIRMDGRMAG